MRLSASGCTAIRNRSFTIALHRRQAMTVVWLFAIPPGSAMKRMADPSACVPFIRRSAAPFRVSAVTDETRNLYPLVVNKNIALSGKLVNMASGMYLCYHGAVEWCRSTGKEQKTDYIYDETDPKTDDT